MTLTVLFPAQAGVIPRASRPAVVFETVPRASGGNSEGVAAGRGI